MNPPITKKLSNGLTIITDVDFTDLDAVYFQLSLPVGGIHEAAGEHGFSHIIEHAMSDKLHDSFAPASWITSYIRDTFSAAVYAMATVYSFAVPKDELSQAINALSIIFGQLELSDEQLKAQFAVIAEEALENRNTLESRYTALMYEGYYGPDSPLGLDPDVIDEPDSAKEVLAFQRRHYVLADAVLAVAGEVNAETLAVELENALPASLGSSSGKSFDLPAPPAQGKQLHLQSYKADQVKFGYYQSYSWHILKDVVVLDLLSGILRNYLWRYLRDRGLIYDLEVGTTFLKSEATLYITAGFSPAKMLPFYAALEQALRSTPDMLTNEIYASYVHQRITTMMIDQYYPLEQLDILIWQYQLLEKIVSIPDLCNIFRCTTREEVLTVFNQLFAENGKVFILGNLPKSDRDTVKQHWDKWWQSTDTA